MKKRLGCAARQPLLADGPPCSTSLSDAVLSKSALRTRFRSRKLEAPLLYPDQQVFLSDLILHRDPRFGLSVCGRERTHSQDSATRLGKHNHRRMECGTPSAPPLHLSNANTDPGCRYTKRLGGAIRPWRALGDVSERLFCCGNHHHKIAWFLSYALG